MPCTGLPQPQPFDVARCIELHNKIVAAVLTSNPNTSVTQGYFTFHAQQSPEMQEHLDQMRADFDDNEDFLYFLDHIDIPNIELSFTLEVMGLTIPCEMWRPTGSPIPDTWFVHLYRGHDWESEGGLVFDLETTSATFVDSLFENVISDSFNFRRTWLGLDTILEEWWARVESGKYVSVPRDSPDQIIMGREPVGWRMTPFRPADLTDTLRAWDAYVEAVTSRMPPRQSLSPLFDSLIVNETSQQDLALLLDKYDIQGFIRSFLLSVRHLLSPNSEHLRFIAPGLLLPTPTFLRHTLSRTQMHQKIVDGPNPDPDPLNRAVIPTTLFPLDISNSDLNTTHLGLVLSVDDCAWPDTVALCLPADDVELPESAPRPLTSRQCNPLFQPGQCPFGCDHSVRFANLLRQWTRLVTEGVWTVGRDGVEGGVEWLTNARRN